MLVRSRQIMTRMARRVLSNKYLWVVIGLIVAAIIFIIVWRATGRKANVNLPDQIPQI